MEAIIHLELYPRSQIDVFVEVLQVDGSDYCASVNAATLALIDAGIPIKVNLRRQFCSFEIKCETYHYKINF